MVFMQASNGVNDPKRHLGGEETRISGETGTKVLVGETVTRVLVNDLLPQIFSMLSRNDVLNAGRVCKRWNHLSRYNVIWAPILQRLLPGLKFENLLPGLENKDKTCYLAALKVLSGSKKYAKRSVALTERSERFRSSHVQGPHFHCVQQDEKEAIEIDIFRETIVKTSFPAARNPIKKLVKMNDRRIAFRVGGEISVLGPTPTENLVVSVPEIANFTCLTQNESHFFVLTPTALVVLDGKSFELVDKIDSGISHIAQMNNLQICGNFCFIWNQSFMTEAFLYIYDIKNQSLSQATLEQHPFRLQILESETHTYIVTCSVKPSNDFYVYHFYLFNKESVDKEGKNIKLKRTCELKLSKSVQEKLPPLQAANFQYPTVECIQKDYFVVIQQPFAAFIDLNQPTIRVVDFLKEFSCSRGQNIKSVKWSSKHLFVIHTEDTISYSVSVFTIGLDKESNPTLNRKTTFSKDFCRSFMPQIYAGKLIGLPSAKSVDPDHVSGKIKELKIIDFSNDTVPKPLKQKELKGQK